MSQAKPKETNGDTAGRLSMDVKHIKTLIDLMIENDLSRMELHEGESHIVLRRGRAAPPTSPNAAPAPTIPLNPVAPPAPPAPAVPTDTEQFIRSPMVGTFYASADPESPPFVNIGSVIDPNTVVCLIEAMKVFNELKAETSGRITKVLVKSAAAVEFDQPLFAVVPA